MFVNPLSVRQWQRIASDMEVGDRVTMGSVTLERGQDGFNVFVCPAEDEPTHCETFGHFIDALNAAALVDSVVE